MGVFHDVLFPPTISLGAEGGPEFQTRVITTSGGHEYRNVEWDIPRGRWNVAHGVKTREEAMALRDFFYQRRGRAFPFRFKDWFDYEGTAQSIGTGNGTQAIWKLYRWYGTGAEMFGRRIMLPVNSAVYLGAAPLQLFSNGTLIASNAYTVDWLKGIITFIVAPLTGVVLTWSGEYHCACRFDTDYFNPTLVEHDYIDWPDISVLELRPEEFLTAGEI